jgi:hypothetical protein
MNKSNKKYLNFLKNKYNINSGYRDSCPNLIVQPVGNEKIVICYK